MIEPNLLISIVVSLVFSALFSGVEIAYISSDKLHLKLQESKGLSGKILSFFAHKPSMFIGTMLVGNTIALVVYGSLMALALEPILYEKTGSVAFALILQTVISTFVVLALAEFLPKNLFMINPNKMLSIFALPVRFIYIILFPLVFIIVNFSKFVITKVFKWNYSEETPVYGLTDLNNFISNLVSNSNDEKEDVVDLDTQIFTNALEFKKLKVRDCMIPRTEVEAIDISAPIDELHQLFVSSGYSKILIYKESIDNIVGYCHSSTMFKKPKDIESILSSIPIVPETMLANELLLQFIQERKNIALIVDEFGGTSGIVTMEDVMEEIFGDIMDEHDGDNLIEYRIGVNTFIMSGRLEVNYLNEKYGWSIPEGEYDTLGGYILKILGEIPRVNQIISEKPFTFTIKSMDGTRIDEVNVYVDPSAQES